MNSTKVKRIYSIPHVEAIQLDNDISLALASDPQPPAGPDEEAYIEPKYFNNDPFKSNLA